MSDKIYLIGNKSDFEKYKENSGDVNYLPIKNLPMCYFPFYYANKSLSVDKLKRIVPLLESSDTNGAKENINTEKLFQLLMWLEESYQPYNNNNIFHIKIVIIVVWILVFMFLLKLASFYLKQNYTYIILGIIVLLLIMSSLWALIVVSKSF